MKKADINTHKNHLKLSFLSLSDEKEAVDIFNFLEQFRYPLQIDRHFDFTQDLSAYDAIIISLSATKLSKQKIYSTLVQINSLAKPTLAILCDSIENWDQSILEYYGDFIVWPVNERELAIRVRNLIVTSGSILSKRTDRKLHNEFIAFNLIGKAPSFLRVLQKLKKIAQCDATILIEGETGTGKELAARAIHYTSNRRDHPFLPVNCGAIPDTLFESELFGHVKGAFTDAKSSYSGLISQANGGTLFLDEVEALSLKGQITLLRFLQEGELRAVGSSRQRVADVRIIAASNTNLEQLTVEKKFRPDFLYRLNIMYLLLPPLRERIEDIEILCEHFLKSYRIQYSQPTKYIHPGSISWMKHYHWPGNVRELENLIHREFLMSDDSCICIEKAFNDFSNMKDMDVETDLLRMSFNQAKTKCLENFERVYLSHLMAETNGNVTAAAYQAGKERRSLGKLLKKYNIDRTAYF